MRRLASVAAVAEVLRDRSGPGPRLLSDDHTREGAIFQLRAEWPRAVGCIYWRITCEASCGVLTPWYSGITEVTALIGITGANVAMILFGWLQERFNTPGRTETTMLPFWFGTVAGVIPWIAIWFNVVTAETLREAQRDPRKHRHLIVRVAGYSDYFCDLSKELQEEIIARTEHETSG